MALTLAALGLLAWTWVGYPLAMRVLGGASRVRAADDPAAWPSVSVVLATRDAAELVAARVADIRAAQYAGSLEVVVALDGATADVARVPAAGTARVVPGDAPGGKASALNAGVRAATGEVLVFTDTHQRFAPDAITLLVRRLLAGPYAAVSGQLELPEAGSRSLVERYWRMERRLRADEARLHSAIGVSGSIWAMRRDRWAPLPAGLILDDLYTPMRLVLDGDRVGYLPDAVARDARRTDAGAEYQRKVRTLTGNFQLVAWLPAVLVPVRNPAWVQFVSHKLLRLLTPWLCLLIGVGVLWLAVRRFGAAAFVAVPLLVAAGAGAAALAGQWSRCRALARWFILMQAAIVMATLNGLTARWNVWTATQRARNP